MTAAALLVGDVEERLPHWERENGRVDRATVAQNRNEIRRGQEQRLWETE